MEGRGSVQTRAFMNVCVRRGAARSIMTEQGVREVSDKEDEERERDRERPGQSNERTPAEGWVGALPGGGNLSNWFSLTARTQSCLSTWQTDSVRFSPMY